MRTWKQPLICALQNICYQNILRNESQGFNPSIVVFTKVASLRRATSLEDIRARMPGSLWNFVVLT